MLHLYEYVKKVSIEIDINKAGIIGRKGDIEPSFFAGQKYLSEEHCEIYRKNGYWYITHRGDTYPTVVNGVQVPKGSSRKLKQDDIIKLADLWFKVSITDEKVEVREIVTFKIVCPVCGRSYYGADENFSVSECQTPACFEDSMDRRKVAKIRAVKEVRYEEVTKQ